VGLTACHTAGAWNLEVVSRFSKTFLQPCMKITRLTVAVCLEDLYSDTSANEDNSFRDHIR